MNAEPSPGNKPLDEQAAAAIAQVAAQVAAQTVSQLTQNLAGQQASAVHAMEAKRRSSESDRHAELVRQIEALKQDHLRELSRIEAAVEKAVTGFEKAIAGVNAKVDTHDNRDDVRFAEHSRTLWIGVGIMSALVFLIGAWQFIARMFTH